MALGGQVPRKRLLQLDTLTLRKRRAFQARTLRTIVRLKAPLVEARHARRALQHRVDLEREDRRLRVAKLAVEAERLARGTRLRDVLGKGIDDIAELLHEVSRQEPHDVLE